MATRKETDVRPQITAVAPAAAIPGGEFQIHGRGLGREPRPRVADRRRRRADRDRFGLLHGGACARRRFGRRLVVSPTESSHSNGWSCDVGVQIVDNVHPVANPGRGPSGQHLYDFQRLARAEDAGGGLQDRYSTTRRSRSSTT